MKTILLIVLVATFLTIGLLDQSWAMGRRGGNRGGGSSNFSNHSDHQSNSSLDSSSNTQQYYLENNSQETGNNNPSVVPEPMTLSLLGMGLTGVLLRRRMR